MIRPGGALRGRIDSTWMTSGSDFEIDVNVRTAAAIGLWAVTTFRLGAPAEAGRTRTSKHGDTPHSM